MTATRLTLLAIVGEPGIVELFRRVFDATGDRLLLATDMAGGLALAASEQPELVFVDVSLGHNAGLALIHHVGAVAASATVYALANVRSLEIGAQAVALGGAGLILMPASGDELLLAASEVRAKHAARRERGELQAQADLSVKGGEFLARLAPLADMQDRAEATKVLASVFAGATGSPVAAVYVPASEGSNELVRSALFGVLPDSPSFVDELGLMAFAKQAGMDMIPLTLGQIASGHVLVRHKGGPSHSPAQDPLVQLLAGQSATMLAFLGERERSTRGAIKDRTTSAYTFAYFVDIAGREIDKARRYGRRFALATIAMEEETGEISTDLTEVILTAVRDTDVLARVDESEFYLLMPETGGVGAQSCRRRVIEYAASRKTGPGQREIGEITMGVATYPHDGADLSKLLRAAKRRSERARGSVVRSLGLVRMSFGSIVDELLRSSRSGVAVQPAHDAVCALDLSLTDIIGVALSAVGEALRGGPAFVAVAHHPGLGLSSAIAATYGHDRDGLAIHTLDLRAVAGCEDLQAVSVIAEHGTYLLAGRSREGVVHAVHAADPLLVDLVTRRFGQAAGVRLLD